MGAVFMFKHRPYPYYFILINWPHSLAPSLFGLDHPTALASADANANAAQAASVEPYVASIRLYKG